MRADRVRGWVTVAAAAGLILATAPASIAATPPDVVATGQGVPAPLSKPADLPLRLPWKAGETFRFSNVYGGGHHQCTKPGGSQDCYALDVAGMSTSSEIYPLFPGRVVFAGCAVGGWSSYGMVAYIESRVGARIYGALYAHLSSLVPVSSKTTAKPSGRRTSAGMKIGRNQPIAMAGGTTTSGGDCSPTGPGNQPGNVHLHFAIYEFNPAAKNQTDWIDPKTGLHKQSWWKGGPWGGRAIVPEPMLGRDSKGRYQAYENFYWWQEPLRAVNLNSQGTVCPLSAGVRTCKWLESDSEVVFGEPVKYRVRVRATKPIVLVNLTASYDPDGPDAGEPSWPQAPPPQFDPQKIWRVVATCRPPPSRHNDCVWSRLVKNSRGHIVGGDVEFHWDPAASGPPPAGVRWLPSAHPVKSAGSGPCVPIKISFDIYDAAGGVKLAGDRVLPAVCPAAAEARQIASSVTAVATVPGAQVVYLRPSVPRADRFSLKWAIQFGVPQDFAQVNGVAIDDLGIIAVGREAPSYNGWIRRYDSSGQLQWSSVIGSYGWLLCPGYIDGHLAANSSGVVFAFADETGTYLRQYDRYGNILWTTSVTECPDSVSANESGVMITNSVHYGRNHSNGLVSHYDRTGRLDWSDEFGGGGAVGVFNSAGDALGFTVGGSTAYMALDGGPTTSVVDAYLRRYDNQGVAQWTFEYGAEPNDQLGIYGLSPFGNHFVAIDNLYSPSEQHENWRLVGISASGDGTGSMPITTNPETPYFVYPSADHVLISGNVSWGGPVGSDYADGFASLYELGNPIPVWHDEFGTANTDYVNGVAADDSRLVVAGTTYGALAGPLTGYADAYIRYYER